MSATVPRLLLPPFPSPPVPGFVEVVQPVSCVPKPAVKGVPRFSPWPGMVRQFTPSVKPALAQVTLFVPMLTTPEPGKLKHFAAMLPEGAKAANAGVSYQPFEMLELPWLDRKSTRLNSSHLGISYAVFCLKKKKIKLNRDVVHGVHHKILDVVRRLRLHPLALVVLCQHVGSWCSMGNSTESVRFGATGIMH